jgi:uncharacterized protein YxjI
MSTALSRLDLSATEFTVEQSLVRNKYAVYGPDGELVCRGKQKLFRMREAFPFVDAHGDDLFTVKAKNLLDVAGDYAVQTPDGETIAILEKNLTLLVHSWTVRAPDGRVLAEVRSGSKLLELLRNVAVLASLVPHRYTIEDGQDRSIGAIEGQFSIRDRYRLRLDADVEEARAAIVASVVAVDALEGN